MKQKIRNLINLKTTSAFLSLLFFIIFAGGMAINAPSASATVTVDTQPTTDFTTGTYKADAVFSVVKFGISEDTSETLSSVAVTVVAESAAVSGDFASLKVYKEVTGTGFSALDDLLVGTQTTVSVGSATTISTGTTAIGATEATFYVVVTLAASPTDTNAFSVDVATDGIVASTGALTTTALDGSGTATATIDTTAPTVVLTSSESDLTSTSPFSVTITFSEAVTTFVVGDITVGNGAAGNFAATSALIYTADITPTADGAVTVDVAGSVAIDAASNNNTVATQFSIVYDGTAPTLTSAIFTDTALKVGETSLVTFTFSEAITGFANTDLTIVNGALTTVTDAGAGTIWTATFTPTDDLEDATNVIAVDLTGVTDTATNAGVGSTNSSNYAIDTKEPTAAMTYSDSSVTSGESLTITATFSEAMADSPVVKIALSGANTVSATDMTKVTTTSYTYTYTVTAGAGTVTVALSTGTDVATNVITSAPTSGATFTTANSGSAIVSPIPISTIGQAAATPANGGIISKTNADGTSAKVVLPAGALTANAVITINPTAKTEAVASMPMPSERNIVGNYAYNFTAVSGLNAAVNTFQKALILTFTYTNEQAEGKNEEALKVHYWDEDLSQWVALEDSVVDTVNKTVTAATTHFTYFAIIEGQSSEIIDGDIIQCASSSNPFAVYIVKVVGDTKYIRHIVSLEIFNYYTHLDWNNLKQVDSLTPYSLSGWARVNTGPDGTPGPTDKVYEINGDQSKHWINMTAEDFLTHGGSDEAVYSVNQGELNLYTIGPDVMSL